jgi:hypothetical protein
MREHPELFEPRVRPFGVGQRRMREVAGSIEEMARTIGRYLAARADALADARELRERLLRVDITPQVAVAYLKAEKPRRSPRMTARTTR